MYFFLDNRAKQLNAKIAQIQNGVGVFKAAVRKELAKPNPGKLAIQARETANKLARNLRNYSSANVFLEEKTHSVFGLLSSLFLPWTEEYRLREKTGNYLAKAESKFNKFTHLACQSTKQRR